MARTIWDIINFAPAYNGIPDGDFSPDKGLVVPDEVGLQPSITDDDDVIYRTRAGYCLVNLAQAQDEWAVKDLRSYLQRPVLSIGAFIDAICNPANNGGYEVDASVVKDYLRFGKYTNLWMTLPRIPSIGTIRKESGELSLSISSVATSGNAIGRFNISGSVPSGTMVRAGLSCKVRFALSGADAYTSLSPYATTIVGRNTISKFSAIFIQAVAYASDDTTVVGGSNIKVYGGRDLKGIAAGCGFTPLWPAEYESLSISEFRKVSSWVWEMPNDLGFTVEAQDVASYVIYMYVYSATRYVSDSAGGRPGQSSSTAYSGGDTSLPQMFASYDTSFVPSRTSIVQGVADNSISYTSSASLRSGAVITKRMLLSSSHTPAEYLLSFCKMFGLYFTFDVATKKVTILRRNDLYQDETIDLSTRVDVGKGVTIRPLVYNVKWYDFMLEGAGGAFYDEYQDVEGVPYGMQRVNTGFDFNADTLNLMDSVVFKNACTTLAKSKYFNYIFKGQTFQPSPFLDKGNTYTLWSDDGNTIERDISCPPTSAVVEYYNEYPEYKGYDVDTARKLELRDAENKPVGDGADILVFFEGWSSYDYFKLSDDVPAMDVLNDGVPCWLLGARSGQLSVPIFQRYIYGNIHVIEDSLDFGIPKQLDIPGVRFQDGSALYSRAWQRYIEDRLSANTKVMTCWVNFSGIQVNQGLLRKFYWFDNTLWVLNKISNYSLTTFDPVECEFVQVQDKDSYLNGQSY